MGPPGSGKGTQAKYISEKYQLAHISTGDIIRENIKNGTELGKEFKEYAEKGALVPDDLIINMMKERISYDDCNNGFLLDGFPRTTYQANALSELTDLDAVLNLYVSDNEVTTRLLKRAEIEGRADDTKNVIKNRLSVYRNETAPLIGFYKEKGIMNEINGEQTVEKVFADIQHSLEKFQ